LNFATFSEDVLDTFNIMILFSVEVRHIHSIFSMFLYRPTSLPVFFFIVVFMFSSDKLAAAQTSSWCVHSIPFPPELLHLPGTNDSCPFSVESQVLYGNKSLKIMQLYLILW